MPLAVLGLMQARDRRSLRPLSLAAFWTVWQFYCSIYIGYFLVLLLVALVLAQALCATAGPVAGLRSWPRSVARAWAAQPRHDRLAFVATMAVAGAAMAALFKPHGLAGHVYGFHRPWWEVASMLPRPVSYLLSTNSRLWPATSRWFADLPLPWEHALFLGIAPFVVAGTSVILRLTKRTRFDRLAFTVALAWLMLIAGTLYLDGFTLYRPIAALPGVDAIRAMTRIVLVMLFPAGIVVASSIDAILAARLPGWLRAGTVGAFAGLLMFEASFIQPVTVSKQVLRDRIGTIEALLPAHLPEAPILLLGPMHGTIDDERQLDAMLFAQERGWPTINGYSGNWPPFYVSPTDCVDGIADLTRGLEFFKRAPEREAMAKRILPLGYAACPDPSAVAGSPSSSSP